MQVDFYHLQTQTLEDVLPKLLEKAYASGKKTVVKVGTAERVEFLNTRLWTYDDTSFLPHGSRKDGNAEMQPVWLTSGEDIPNGAAFLFLVDGAQTDAGSLNGIERIFNIFDGNSPDAVSRARRFWKELKEQNHTLSYWQQENGRWIKKA
ncbi:MAG: DNA polymerase III subunit chi [Alphaproteobacteria bacterium]|nr:DNA polymerase III subunit chi [Alphaproteobacteria bacterium]